MTRVERALTTFQMLAPEQQEAVADFIMEAAMPVIEFGDDELKKIDDGTAAADAGEFASEQDVRKLSARFH